MSSVKATVPSLGVKPPSIAGYLFRKGYFKDWQQRHTKLDNNLITIKNGLGSVTFKINANTICEENPSLRPFCFILTNPNNEIIHLAAENNTIKDQWVTAVYESVQYAKKGDSDPQVSISQTTSTTVAPVSKPKDIVMTLHMSPLFLKVKIKKCRNLINKSSSGLTTIDTFVHVTVGSNTMKTSTVTNSGNPAWGKLYILYICLLYDVCTYYMLSFRHCVPI